MYISNNSGMATLLQQKNCMKTLTNGGVSSAANSNASSTGSSAGAAAGVVHQGINANGGNTLVTHHHLHHHHISSGVSAQQSRMLKPHEIVSIPIGSIVSTVGSGVNVGSGTQGAFLVTGYQTTSHHNHHSQPLTDLSSYTSSHHQSNTMFSHNNQQQHYNATVTAATANTTASGTTQTRYFSQFSNNHQQELNSILYPTTTAAGTNTVNRLVSTNHLTSLPANSNLNVLNRTNANAIVKQEPLPPNPNSSATSQQLQQHHLQILERTIKEESPADDQQRVNGDDRHQSAFQNGTVTPTSNPATPPPPNGTAQEAAAAAAVEEQEPEPEIDIVINNVVCSFSVRCHLNLREIALNGFNVEFRRENGMVTMKLRHPYTTASIWSSGRITCTGATSENQAKIAARRYARCLQKLGFRVRFNNFRVVNVLGTCSMPFAINIINFSERYKKEASYEPELHPGVTYKLRFPKATLKIFSTGSITVTAASVANVQAAIEHIFPLVYEFRKKRTPEEMELLRQKQLLQQQHHQQQNVVESRDVQETVLHSPPSAKRKRRKLDGGNGAELDIDDPDVTDPNYATDDIIMVSEFDDPDDLIEGPDDDDDL